MASPLLLVHALLLSEVFGAEASSWTATVPSTVAGLPGSCVVIPCSYNYPTAPETITKFTGIWRDKTSHVVFHPDGSKIQQGFKNRTALLGDVSQKNCSLKVDPLRESDVGPFHFRIEMAGYNSFSYMENVVSIRMLSQLNPISFTLEEVDNKTMTASCSVSHSCPASPPVFTWSHSGLQHSYPHLLSDGQWTLASTLTFHPTYADHRQTLQCTVTYRGGQQQNASRILEVKYAPVKVVVDHVPQVREGDSVLLRCSSDANPPATGFLWHNASGALLASGRNHTLVNVSRHSEGIFCSASNAVGTGTSSTVQLNVIYSPEIKPVSTCFLHESRVRCDCIVESRPPSTVRFLVSDKVVSSKVERHGDITIATLQTDLEASRSVSCQAENTIGRSSAQLSSPENRKMKTIYIVIFITAAAIFVIVFTVVLRKCLRSSTDVPALQLSGLQAPRALTTDLAGSSESKQVYDDARKPNVSSEPVYGNMQEETYMEADDDAVYANV
ncbi:myelin-associated glycoprotein isoform 1-T2 [Synchiropus picturatus]